MFIFKIAGAMAEQGKDLNSIAATIKVYPEILRIMAKYCI